MFLCAHLLNVTLLSTVAPVVSGYTIATFVYTKDIAVLTNTPTALGGPFLLSMLPNIPSIASTHHTTYLTCPFVT